MENENVQNPMPQQQFQPNMPIQLPVPNSTAVLVLGILSIVMCWCYGLIGLALGIITLVLAGKGMTAYNENPGKYSESSFKNLKAGRICSIVGISLSALYLIFIIIYIAIIGAAVSTLPWDTFKY